MGPGEVDANQQNFLLQQGHIEDDFEMAPAPRANNQAVPVPLADNREMAAGYVARYQALSVPVASNQEVAADYVARNQQNLGVQH